MSKRTNEFQTVVYHTYAHMADPTDRVTESATLKERGDGAEREVDTGANIATGSSHNACRRGRHFSGPRIRPRASRASRTVYHRQR